jgi:hypothetical protein
VFTHLAGSDIHEEMAFFIDGRGFTQALRQLGWRVRLYSGAPATWLVTYALGCAKWRSNLTRAIVGVAN